jgi:hypothetical protein
MELIVMVKAAILFFGGALCVTLLSVAYRLLRSDKGDYNINRIRSGRLLDPILGRVKTSRSGYRDFRVQAGLAVDRQTNTWVEQGILSEEAIDAVLQQQSQTN